jgi:ribosomal protein L32E
LRTSGFVKARLSFQKAWEDNKKFNMDQRKKGDKPPFFRNNPQGKKQHKEPRTIDTRIEGPRKPPMQCWGYKGDHRFRDCPPRGEKGRVVHNVQKVEIVEDMGRYVPRIYATLDNKQAEYQSHMIEVEGMINNQTIAILIDSGASHSYIDPKMVESLQFPRRKHLKSWLVQLAIGAKRKFNEMVNSCLIYMNGMNTKAYLNILSLGSYDYLIGMDWLDQHHTLLDYHNKASTCLAEEGKLRKVQGIPKVVTIRDISALQLKKCYIK